MDSDDGKDIYRKRSYTPPKEKIKPNPKYKPLLKSIPKFIKESPSHPLKEFSELIYEIGQRGACLDIIFLCIDFPKGPFGLQDPAEHNKRVTGIKNKIKSVSGRFSQTIKIAPLKVPDGMPDELLKTITQFNDFLIEKQKELEEVRRLYLSLMEYLETENLPPRWKPMGLITRTGIKKVSSNYFGVSKQINKKIVPVVDELLRIGYSERSAYLITGKLLKASYPKYWKDSDPDLIRQRYTYQKQKSSNHPK